MSALIGKKLGMTRIFLESGESVPVTVLQAGPCYITNIRTVDKNGYDAVQIGFGETDENKLTNPQAGYFKKHNLPFLKYLKEFRNLRAASSQKIGDKLEADVFKRGELVQVTGKSKGKGFQGVVKRYNFHGGPKTHGQSDRLRAPGSIGQSATPSRVMKGMKMPGRMGNRRVTIKDLEVMQVDPERNVIMVNGSVPGSKNSIVYISK